jgi:PAS domain S-box-containing protein
MQRKKKKEGVALKYANAIISTLREPFLVLDEHFRVISVNRSFLINFKVSKKETIGQSFFVLGNGQWNVPALTQLLKKVLPHKTVVTDYEIEHDFETIGQRVMNLNIRQLRMPEKITETVLETAGRNLILLAIEDITDRKKIEKQLADAKARDEAILASTGDALMACDKEGQITLFNRMAETLTGFSATEVIGLRYDHFVKFVRESDETPINDFIAEAIQNGKATKMTNHTLLTRKDGSKTPVADSAAPIKDSNGVLVGCVVVFRDVTREREIDRAKTEFVSLASHQLKTPPTAVKWITEMLIEDDTGNLTKKQKKYLEDVYSKNEQMIKLVNSLLDVSRIELGTFSISPTLIDINSLIQSVVTELARETTDKKLHIQEKYSRQKPTVRADDRLIRMVFTNILTNAIQYTPPGGEISIEILLKRKGEASGEKKITKDSVVCMIADSGCGIPREQQGKIFTKLFRADNAQKNYTHGTGLGLYLVKMILDNIGGTIWFHSEENKGATFYIAIPLITKK